MDPSTPAKELCHNHMQNIFVSEFQWYFIQLWFYYHILNSRE